MNWFLYDRGLCHERVKMYILPQKHSFRKQNIGVFCSPFAAIAAKEAYLGLFEIRPIIDVLQGSEYVPKLSFRNQKPIGFKTFIIKVIPRVVNYISIPKKVACKYFLHRSNTEKLNFWGLISAIFFRKK